jgi:hypothetical protein
MFGKRVHRAFQYSRTNNNYPEPLMVRMHSENIYIDTEEGKTKLYELMKRPISNWRRDESYTFKTKSNRQPNLNGELNQPNLNIHN